MMSFLPFRENTFYVVGLGKSGCSALSFLKEQRASLYAWDDAPSNRTLLKTKNIPCVGPKDVPWKQISALVLSPGIPHRLPKPHLAAQFAEQHKVPIICDVELFFQFHNKARFVGITGSHGKSTTTSLIAHVLSFAGIASAAGGNIGVPVFSLPLLDESGTYVMELSSFQLERIQTPLLDIAIFLNISPNHLDRHGDMTHYQQSKLHIFDLLKKTGRRIIGVDDILMQDVARSLCDETTVLISGSRRLERGVYVESGCLIDHIKGEAREIADLTFLSPLRGAHNYQNIAASYAAVQMLGSLEKDVFIRALQTYKSLPHRQEYLGTQDNVAFINDSKATTLEAATKSLGAFSSIYWILGGEAKEGSFDLESIRPFFSHIIKAYAIGSSAEDYHNLLKNYIPIHVSKTLPGAVKQAFADALKSRMKATILLAPACASYDQYRNFEERGNHFRTLSQKIFKNKKDSS